MSSCSTDAAESEVDITWEEEDEVDTKAAVAATDGWHIFGRECPKEEIVFLCQHLQPDCRARRLDALDRPA